jgi:hypothetical protein
MKIEHYCWACSPKSELMLEKMVKQLSQITKGNFIKLLVNSGMLRKAT